MRAPLTAAVLIATLLALAAGGCTRAATGALRAQSLGRDPVILQAKYSSAFYAPSSGNVETSFCLTDLPEEALLSGAPGDGQIVHINLLWKPKAGRTPIDDSAVDASVRYIIIANGEVGVYGGAGFVVPHGSVGRRTLSVSVRAASLTLLESTSGFVDRLGCAELTGKFTAVQDELKTRQIQHAAAQIVSSALGKARYVRGEDERGDSVSRPRRLAWVR